MVYFKSRFSLLRGRRTICRWATGAGARSGTLTVAKKRPFLARGLVVNFTQVAPEPPPCTNRNKKHAKRSSRIHGRDPPESPMKVLAIAILIATSLHLLWSQARTPVDRDDAVANWAASPFPVVDGAADGSVATWQRYLESSSNSVSSLP